MKKPFIKIALAVSILAVSAATGPAAGATLTYDLGTVDTESGRATTSGPLVHAVFSSLAADQVMLHIEVTNWMGTGAFLSEIGFNSNLGRTISIQPCSGKLCAGADFGTAPHPTSVKRGSIPPAGTFSIVFDFPQSKGPGPNRFERGEYVNYILRASGLTVENFDAFSDNKDKKNRYKSYAHIQGAGDGKIFDNNPDTCVTCTASPATAVSEPGLTLLLGSGLTSLAFIKRRAGMRQHSALR